MTSQRLPTVSNIRMKRIQHDVHKKMISTRPSTGRFPRLRRMVAKISENWAQFTENVSGYARIAGFVLIFLMLPPNPKRSFDQPGRVLKQS